MDRKASYQTAWLSIIPLKHILGVGLSHMSCAMRKGTFRVNANSKDPDQPAEKYSQITKTRLYNFYPLNPTFILSKLGSITGVYIIFLNFAKKKHRLRVLVRTASARQF